MLPVSTGFILPNGTRLETDSTGHRKCAERYIREHGLKERYKAYEQETSGGEDEFLVDVLGALKVCHYCGIHYLYVPKIPNEYKEYVITVIREYKKKNFHIKYLNSCVEIEIHISEKVRSTSKGYNRTVMETIENGKKRYIYNPNRIGD